MFHSVCLSVRPPCTNTTGHLLPICHGSCLAFKKNFQEGRCDSLLQLIEGFFLFDLLTQLDCTNPSTYYFFDNLESRIDTEECTHLIQPSQAGQCSPLFVCAACVCVTVFSLIQLQSCLAQICELTVKNDIDIAAILKCNVASIM